MSTPTGAALHVLRVEMDDDSLRCRVECRAGDGAECHLVCAEDCGAESMPCYSYDGGDEREHELKDGGYCNIANWLNDDSPTECHQNLTEPVFDGMPILAEWEGDYYSWRGAAPCPVADSLEVSGV